MQHRHHNPKCTKSSPLGSLSHRLYRLKNVSVLPSLKFSLTLKILAALIEISKPQTRGRRAENNSRLHSYENWTLLPILVFIYDRLKFTLQLIFQGEGHLSLLRCKYLISSLILVNYTFLDKFQFRGLRKYRFQRKEVLNLMLWSKRIWIKEVWLVTSRVSPSVLICRSDL